MSTIHSYLGPVALAEGAPSSGEERVEERNEPGALKPVERRAMDLPRLLRWIGGIVLVASACSFVLHSWASLDPMRRYLTFFGFTGVLAGAGLFCGLQLREDKGARTFLALAAAFLPAHFLQLAAFVYHQLIGTPRGLPAFFVLQAPSPTALVLTLIAAVPLLIGTAFLGFSALARSEARALTLTYALANLALMIPTRNPDIIGLFALAAFLGVAAQTARLRARASILETFDGTIALSLLQVPVLLLVIRNMSLYDITALLVSAVATAGAILAFSSARQIFKTTGTKKLAERIGFALTALAWYQFVVGLFFNPSLGSMGAYLDAHRDAALLPFFALPYAVIVAIISLTIPERGANYRRFAAWLAILAMVNQLFTVPGLVSSLLCVLTGAVTLVLAFEAEERGLFYSGAFGLVAGLLYHLRYATELYAMSPWLTLAIPGVLLILLSSYIERNGGALLERVKRLKAEVDGWR